MSDTWNIAVVGADGVVGKAVLELLEEQQFPVEELYCLSADGEGDETVLFNNRNYELLASDAFDFSRVSIAIFSDVAGTEVELPVKAAKAGAMVITNQPAFAYASDIPLVVAGINDEALAEARNHNIVAVPDASATIALQVLKPVYEEAGLASIDVVALEAVSSAGQAGISELANQTAMLLNAKPAESKVFGQQIAFNVLALSGEVADNGYTRHETGLIHAIQKVLGDHALEVDVSVVQVPVFYGHTLELVFSTQQTLSLDALLRLWKGNPGLKQVASGAASPVTEAAESGQIYISRCREVAGSSQRFRSSLVADNVRVGQADNLVKVAEILVRDYL